MNKDGIALISAPIMKMILSSTLVCSSFLKQILGWSGFYIWLEDTRLLSQSLNT